MKTVLSRLVMLAAIVTIAGCSSHSNNQSSFSQSLSNMFQSSTASQSTTTAATAPIAGPAADSDTPAIAMGGSMRAAMDNVDKSKLSHAMDKSPGKSTHWVNSANGTKYTVTPVRAVSVNGNHYCRQYSLSAERSGKTRTTTGVACVGDDTNWKDVGN
jgi:surface antigen